MKSKVLVPRDYFPSDDEPFMNEIQVEYFRQKLILWKSDLVSDSKDTIETLQDVYSVSSKIFRLKILCEN